MKLKSIDKSLDCIKVQSGEMLFVLKFDRLQDGIISFIEQFGNLYYGSLNQQIFLKMFVKQKNNLIWNLLNVKNILSNEDILESTRFNLYMCKSSVHQFQWGTPATVSWHREQRYWFSGQDRILASGLSKGENQHQLLKILCLEHPKNDINEFLESPIKIRDDRQLNGIFGLSSDSDNSHLISLYTRLLRDINGHTLVLELIGDEAGYVPEAESKKSLDTYVNWREVYGPRPKLHVYTDWPELLTNTYYAWEVVHAGPSVFKKDDLHSGLGFLENKLRFRSDEEFVRIHPHTLFMIEPVRIDVAEFLFWMDLEHSTYVGNDLQYLLYRDSSEYRSTFIRTSSLLTE